MSLPRLAVERPITTAMLLLSMLVFGALAMVRLPLAFLPEVDVPFIFAEVPYPDSNPAQVEREIVKPIEEALGTLSGIDRMHTTATADGAEILLEFAWGEDLDIVRMQVSEAIEQVEPQLPEGVGEIPIYSFNTSDIPVVEGRISADGVDLSDNYELLEARVINRLRRLPGVARVDLGGVEPKEIFVDLRTEDLGRHGVSVERLIEILTGSSARVVLGQIEDDGRRFTARALGQLASVEELRALPIEQATEGAPALTLGDVADVTYEEPPIRYGRHLNHQPAIALMVYKESTANTVDVVHSVLGMLEAEIQDDPLLAGIDIFMWQNQADQITEAVDGLTRSGLIGSLLAVLVLYIFLRRFASTFVVSLSIPFSVLATCGVLFFLGKSLNMLSMMGLMLGVGMLVDNAIVVLESIDRRQRLGGDPKQATLEGAQAVSTAVIASTATSLIVFLPLIVGSRSELTVWLGEMGATIAFALVCSLVSSLTLIPLVSSLLGARHARARKDDTDRGARTPPNRTVTSALEERYGRLLAWTLRRRAVTFGLLTVALVVGFLPFPLQLIDASPFSAAVNERIWIQYEFADFVYKGQAEDIVTQVEQALEPHRDELLIESIYSYFAADEAGTSLTLTRRDLGDDELKELRQKVRERLPTIPGLTLRFGREDDEGDGTTAFTLQLYGQDSTALASLAGEAQRRLATLDGVGDLRTSFGDTTKEIEVRVDRAKAARLGITAGEIAETFRFVLGGFRLPRFHDQGREVDAWLALRLEDRTDLADLAALKFREVEGKPVLLSDIATFEVVEKPLQIERENRRVTVAVSATYAGDDWEATRAEVESLMDAFAFPTGYSWSWNRRILEQDDQGQQMATNFLLALVLVYLVMASLFESLAQPFAILFSIPFAVPGAAWLLVATGTPFNLMAQIGLLILMGIVVNNGIVLLDHMNRLRTTGLGPEEAAVQAGRDRLRAILMTASTTVIGLLPLAIGGSRVGGLFYYPLALTVIGGLLSSAVLTLVVLPYVALQVEAVANWLKTLWTQSTPRRRAAEIVEATP
ncbi:MAG: efflux RND transporter permease subunit [Acidobacteriota bacterium]